MQNNENTDKPFGLNFVEEIPDAELEQVNGGAKVQTLALSIATHGPKDNTVYDEF